MDAGVHIALVFGWTHHHSTGVWVCFARAYIALLDEDELHGKSV